VRRVKKKPKFSAWLQQALRLIGRLPWLWLGYTLFVGILLVVGKISLALGILASVTSLFVGVGLAKYTDLKATSENPVSFYWAINKSLPLALLAAVAILFCWFVFMTIANLSSGEFYKIGQFFFNWEFTPENLDRRTLRETVSWIYAYANIALIFVLLMLTTFGSWFSHPLMLFKGERWSDAKRLGDEASSKNQAAILKLQGFIFLEAVLCLTITPLLTPVLYGLVANLMYVSYKSLFEAEQED
jgi:hypothetical protein